MEMVYARGRASAASALVVGELLRVLVGPKWESGTISLSTLGTSIAIAFLKLSETNWSSEYNIH